MKKLLLLLLLTASSAFGALPAPVTETIATAPDGAQLYWIRHMPDPAAINPRTGLPNGPGPYQGILMIHGGGFKQGLAEDSTEQGVAASNFAQAGYVAVSITYRLAPPGNTNGDKIPGQTVPGYAPLQYNDCKVMLKAFRTKTYCNGQVIAIGGSAGGTHVSWLASDASTVTTETATTTVWDPTMRPIASVNLSGCMDFTDWTSDSYNTKAMCNLVSNYVNIPEHCNTAPCTDARPSSGADLDALTNNSVVTVMDATAKPLFSTYSQNDAMPPDQLDDLIARETALGLVSDTTHFPNYKLIPGTVHSWAQWEVPLVGTTVTRDVVIPWVAARFAEAGIPTPTPTPPPTPTPTPTATPVTILSPQGIYGGGTGSWTNVNAHGRYKQYHWVDLQDTDTAAYTLGDVDNQLISAASSGKGFILNLNTNSGVPAQGEAGLPNWLITAGATPYSALNTNHDTLLWQFMPWDPVFIANEITLITHLGARYYLGSPNGCITSIAIGGLGTTTEFGISLDTNGLTADGKNSADALTAWIATAKTLIPAYIMAFPNTTISMSIKSPIGGAAGDTALQTVVDWAVMTYGAHVGFENWGLKNGSNSAYLPNSIILNHSATNPVGHQLTGSTGGGGGPLGGSGTPGQILLGAMMAGISLHDQWIEVFGSDVDLGLTDPEVAAAFVTINGLVYPPPTSTPTPTPTPTPPVQIPTKLLKVKP